MSLVIYGAKDVVALLLYMCKNSICAEQAVSNRNGDGVNGPDANWFLSKIRGMEYDVMLKEVLVDSSDLITKMHQSPRTLGISSDQHWNPVQESSEYHLDLESEILQKPRNII